MDVIRYKGVKERDILELGDVRWWRKFKRVAKELYRDVEDNWGIRVPIYIRGISGGDSGRCYSRGKKPLYVVIERDFAESMLYTLLHEFGHVYSLLKYKRGGHGKGFKKEFNRLLRKYYRRVRSGGIRLRRNGGIFYRYSDVWDFVEGEVKRIGYEIDEHDMSVGVAHGGKLRDGENRRFRFRIYGGDGNEKQLNVQVYREGDKFEVNMYIS